MEEEINEKEIETADSSGDLENISEVSGEVSADVNEDAEESEEHEEHEEHEELDWASVVESDIRELSDTFSELKELKSIAELENPLRYAALRDLGLTPIEAYLATSVRRLKKDNRHHLSSNVPRGAEIPYGAMSERELDAAREIFSDMSDREIRKLYRKVTK